MENVKLSQHTIKTFHSTIEDLENLIEVSQTTKQSNNKQVQKLNFMSCFHIVLRQQFTSYERCLSALEPVIMLYNGWKDIKLSAA